MSKTSFPSNPANGDQETIGGITYEYSSEHGVWLRVLPSGSDEGGSADFQNLTAIAPLQIELSNANRDADISIDLTLINGLP